MYTPRESVNGFESSSTSDYVYRCIAVSLFTSGYEIRPDLYNMLAICESNHSFCC